MRSVIFIYHLSVGLLALIWASSASASDEQLKAIWSGVSKPSDQAAQALGFYSRGCLAGAEALPLQGDGFQVMRPQRNRYYGHPKLIALLKRLGRYAQQRHARVLIGDLSQPRGGPMSYGHASHQIGLDADVWFQHIPHRQALPRREAEQRPMISVVDRATGQLRFDRWSPLYRDVLRFVVQQPEVERIFVNPVIKQALCRDPANHVWLRKIRAWWGHDAHFHVRLTCPSGSVLCKPQKPPPLGSGCDHYLDRWVEEQKSPRPRLYKPRKPLVLPQSCDAVLAVPSQP